MNDNIILYLILNEPGIKRKNSKAYTSIENDLYYTNTSLTGLLIETILKINNQDKNKCFEDLILFRDDLENQIKIIYSRLSAEDIKVLEGSNINYILRENKYLNKSYNCNNKIKINNKNTYDIKKIKKDNFNMLNKNYNRKNIYELLLNETKLYLYKKVLDNLYIDSDFRVKGRVINATYKSRRIFAFSNAYKILSKYKECDEYINLYATLYRNFFINYINELDEEFDYMVFLEHRLDDGFAEIGWQKSHYKSSFEFDINYISELDKKYNEHSNVNDDFANSKFYFDNILDINKDERKSKIEKQLLTKEYLKSAFKYGLIDKDTFNNKVKKSEQTKERSAVTKAQNKILYGENPNKEKNEEKMLNSINSYLEDIRENEGKTIEEQEIERDIREKNEFIKGEIVIINSDKNYFYEKNLNWRERKNNLFAYLYESEILIDCQDNKFSLRCDSTVDLMALIDNEIIKGIKMFVDLNNVK